MWPVLALGVCRNYNLARMHRTIWGWVHRGLTLIYWVVVLTIAAHAGLTKVSKEKVAAEEGWWKALLEVVTEHGWWMIVATTFVSAVVQELRLRIGSPATWRQV